ncbi:MAG: Hexuronate transporter [Firmicutes bacterium ADurb.BinA052]|jgi:MFS family permease|nr:MAG: Hexuronate transporter [Firmicutes bacterium ADurb.BinA052]
METHVVRREGVMEKLRGAMGLFTPALLVFMAGMILANIAGAMNGSLMPLYVQSLGADTKQIGLFFTASAVAPLVLQIVGGFVSDSIGRLKAVAIGSIAGSIGYVLYAVAPVWGWLLVGHAVASLAGCFVAPSFQAFIAEQSTEKTRARVFAVSESAFAVVGIVGPPIGGFLSQRYGFRLMFVAAGALYLAATVIRMAMAVRSRNRLSSTYHAPQKMTLACLKSSMGAMVALVLSGGVMTWLFLSDSVNDVAFSIANHFDPIYQSNIIGMSNIQITWVISAFSIVRMIALPFGGVFADKAGERAGICLGHLLCGLGGALFLLGTAYPHFVLVWALYGLGVALLSPAYNSLVSKEVPIGMRGTAFGLVSTTLGIASLPAPYIGGLMWARFGPKAPFVLPLLASLSMAAILWFKLPGRTDKAEQTAETQTSLSQA